MYVARKVSVLGLCVIIVCGVILIYVILFKSVQEQHNIMHAFFS